MDQDVVNVVLEDHKRHLRKEIVDLEIAKRTL